MNKNLKTYITDVLSDDSKEALNIAAQALYFSDSSDYRSALNDVVLFLLRTPLLNQSDQYLHRKFVDELVHFLNPDWTKDDNL